MEADDSGVVDMQVTHWDSSKGFQVSHRGTLEIVGKRRVDIGLSYTSHTQHLAVDMLRAAKKIHRPDAYALLYSSALPSETPCSEVPTQNVPILLQSKIAAVPRMTQKVHKMCHSDASRHAVHKTFWNRHQQPACFQRRILRSAMLTKGPLNA